MTGLTKEGLEYIVEKGQEKFNDVKFFLCWQKNMPTFSSIYKLVEYYGFEKALEYVNYIGAALYNEGKLVDILVLNENHHTIKKINIKIMETV